MNNRWFCVGRDAIFEGLHGMEATCVIEGTEDDAWDRAADLSRDVISAYEDITSQLEGDVDDAVAFDNTTDEDEIEAIRNEVYENDISTAIFPINEAVAVGLSIRQLNSLAATEGTDSFIQTYCLQNWE